MKKTLSAEILSVGTELLLGNTANTDARDISVYLSELGINVFYHTVVGDNPERLTKAVNIAKTRADIIITTGGLGPTCDDLTKQVLASAFGLKMEFHEELAEEMKRYFKEVLGVDSMTDNNLQQAYLPEGCTVFHNEWGTAPGCAFEAEGVRVIMLPGPPRECNAMFKSCAMPYLRALSDEVIFSHSLHIVGRGESSVEAQLRDMMNELTNPTLAPYAKEGEVMLRVTAKAATEKEAEALTLPVIERLKAELGDVIYGMDVNSLEQVVFEKLREKKLTICTAESCTGGLISKRLTDLKGSSEVFKGGAVTYTEDSKVRVLGVDPATIEANTVVSPEVAMEMAENAREIFGADIALATTGLAGPDGDGVHPLGTVFVALATENETYVTHISGGIGRSRVRMFAANCALDMARRCLDGLPVIVDYFKK
ncbi:MAG: competence/damage-inducible protein A [Oscillospiraceae bacterium]|nr:competence/damage-inducible protein A [Oscillospiraceae bacterium]